LNEIAEPVIKERNGLENTFSEIERTVAKIKADQEKANQTLDEIVELKKMKENLSVEDLSELEDLREKLKTLIIKKREIKNKIETDFSSIARLLKKYRYYEQYGLKSDMKLLELYINEPYDAFLTDEDLKIKKLLENAVLAATAGDIDVDVKTIQRVEGIFDNFDEFKKMKENDAGLSEEIHELQETIQKEWLPRAEHNKAIEKKLREIDARIAEHENEHMKLLGEKSGDEKQLSDAKARLGEMLTEFSGVDVKVV
jgi:chromosome segregation ATPase